LTRAARYHPEGGSEREGDYLDSKIHDDDATLDTLILLTHFLISLRLVTQWNLKYRLVIPLILVFALANLLDDPGIEHWTSPARYNFRRCNTYAKELLILGIYDKQQ
jgi:hypothetical protein